MDIEQQIAELEQRADRLVEAVGMQADFFQEDEPRGTDSGPVTEKKTIADLLTYIRDTRKKILVEQRDFSQLHTVVCANPSILDNFPNFANTVLSVRDKAKLLLVVKEDLLDLREKMNDVARTREVLQRLAEMRLPEDSRLSLATLQRYRQLEARARHQNNSVTALLDAYDQIMQAVNGHLAKLVPRPHSQ